MICECEREDDVLNAISAGRWPERCDEDLRTHVSACVVCADLADVATALTDDRDAACHEARVPPAGVVWWRAQLRAREEAARAAGRPVAFIQGVAASVAVWLMVALFRAVPLPYLAERRTWASSLLPSFPASMADVARVSAAIPLVVFLVVGAWLLLTPLAIYFAVADE